MTARALPGLAPLLALMERAHAAQPEAAGWHFAHLFAAASRTSVSADSLETLAARIEFLTGRRPAPADADAARLPDDAFPALSHVLTLMRLAHADRPDVVHALFEDFIGACEQAGVEAMAVRLLRQRSEVLAGRREETPVVLHQAEDAGRGCASAMRR